MPAAGLSLKVGDVVSVGCPCMGNPGGALAVVVEIYDVGDGPSPSLLFKNGAHDGFSPSDLDIFQVELVAHEHTVASYEFKNAIRLHKDFRAGVFARVWRDRPAAEVMAWRPRNAGGVA
jgi:hypothetical protein